MLEGDYLCRAALYPKFMNSEAFDHEMLLRFDDTMKTGTYAMSVASLFLAKNDMGVHGYGCRAAKIANERLYEKLQRPPEPLKEEIHYLGYYKFTYGDLSTLPMEYYRLNCFWKVEHGEDVHFQAEMAPNGADSTKAKRKLDRLAAVGVLYHRLVGPSRYTDPKDEGYREVLEAVNLPKLPL